MATTAQISTIRTGGNLPEAPLESGWSKTSAKIEKFFTSFEGALTVFSILAGTAIAILWSVPIGLLGAGIGIAASVAISLCRSSKAAPEPMEPVHRTYATQDGQRPRIAPGHEWYLNVVEGPGGDTPLPEPLSPRAPGRQPPVVPAAIVARGLSSKANVKIYQETMDYAKEHFADANTLLAEGASVQVGLQPVVGQPKYPDMRVYVANKSTLRMTQDLVERGLNPLVLDMANAYHAGGGVRRGANAQEEIVCRQSNAMFGLLKMERDGKFPIPELGGLLLPKVIFFRADPNDNYKFLDKPFQADLFALAAYCCIPTNSDRPADEEDYRANTIAKIENYFRAAIANGNDSIVASALGCGAFLNNPVFIAGLFKEILAKPEFQGQFREVAFGIIEDGNSLGRKGNYQVFKEVLEG